MRDRALSSSAIGSGIAAAEFLSREVAILASRLADLLADAPVSNDATVAAGVELLRATA
jgi:hypothetical protein